MTQTPVGGHHVPVTRYPRSSAPEVRLRSDPDAVGVVIERGPEQSIVRWRNGNETCVINAWIIEILTADTEPSKAQGGALKHSQQQAVSGQPQLNARRVDPEIVMQRGLKESERKPRKEPDALSVRVSGHCGTDAARLERFARANGCWADSYVALPNFGLRRMSVVNRLRAKVRKGHAVVWK